MTRYLPIALGVLLIVGLTIIQVQMTDRLAGSNITAEQRAELLQNIPKNIGDWHGTDKPIDEGVRKVAGAIGAVSREYRNVRTGEVVDLWLIVGHGRSISAHTPDICYRNSGFTARAKESSLYPMVQEDETEVPFFTNTFFREDVTGRRLIRVFWNWYNTEKSTEKVVWEAPGNARWYFGNTRALYKMYFTSEMRDPSETAEKSPCLQFAREFLPVVEKALVEVYGEGAKSGPVEKAPGKAEPEAATAAEPEAKASSDEAGSETEKSLPEVPADIPADPVLPATEETPSTK
jgi:hypothetical protein